MFLQVTPLISYNIGELTQQSFGDNLLVETFLNPGLVVKLVLALLLMMSVVCWGIVLYKFVVYHRTDRRSRQFSSLLASSDDLTALRRSAQDHPDNPLKEMFEAGYREFTKRVALLEGGSAGSTGSTVSALWTGEIESIGRALKKAQSEARTNLESALTFLATTGSTAPFIGLFGTVWGIMTSFRSIGMSGNASLAVVAPGIAEALIATAVGLFAAIPAVVAYNYFLNWGRVLGSQMENFSSDFQSMTEHQFRQISTQKNRARQPIAA